MKILLVASQHGNELLGEKLYEHLKQHRAELLPHVEFVLANPEARAKNVRYLDSDMNRSYNSGRTTHEERLASKLLAKIQKTDYDLVLDLHTTSCKQPHSLIVASINSRNKRFLRSSSIQHLVVIDKSVTATALNGRVPQSVSIEVNQNISTATLEALCDDIERYLDEEPSKTQQFLYKASLLRKDEIEPSDAKKLHNFELSHLGFYPILVGENSYQKHGYDYLGFKALTRREFKV